MEGYGQQLSNHQTNTMFPIDDYLFTICLLITYVATVCPALCKVEFHIFNRCPCRGAQPLPRL